MMLNDYCVSCVLNLMEYFIKINSTSFRFMMMIYFAFTILMS